MPLSSTQVDTLIRLVVSAQEDLLDCDRCFGKVAEFAESQLANQPVCEAMRAIETHMKCCPCCADEFQALLDGLRELEQEPRDSSQ